MADAPTREDIFQHTIGKKKKHALCRVEVASTVAEMSDNGTEGSTKNMSLCGNHRFRCGGNMC